MAHLHSVLQLLPSPDYYVFFLFIVSEFFSTPPARMHWQSFARRLLFSRFCPRFTLYLVLSDIYLLRPPTLIASSVRRKVSVSSFFSSTFIFSFPLSLTLRFRFFYIYYKNNKNTVHLSFALHLHQGPLLSSLEPLTFIYTVLIPFSL